MADFLLIHGSCHGAWCWRDLMPALEAAGHTARAIDLPGSGDDPTPAEEVTLASCRDAVLAASAPDTIIVGHSWGGFPISAAAEADPSAMRGLVFLCAYVPVSGLSMVDMRKRSPRQTLTGKVLRDPGSPVYRIDPDAAPGLFYNDCPRDLAAWATLRLTPQPVAPQETPLRLSGNFNAVPKAYIRCTDDQTIPPEYQAHMVADWPRDRVIDMPTSHSPFLSDPVGLATRLGDIAEML